MFSASLWKLKFSFASHRKLKVCFASRGKRKTLGSKKDIGKRKNVGKPKLIGKLIFYVHIITIFALNSTPAFGHGGRFVDKGETAGLWDAEEKWRTCDITEDFSPSRRNHSSN